MAFEEFKSFTFTQIQASSDIINAQVYRKSPASVRLGRKNRDNGGFFDYDKILDAADKNRGSVLYGDEQVIIAQSKATKEIGIFLASSLFNEMMTDYISSQFSSQAATQMTNQFNSQIANAANNMPAADRYVNILTAPFEPGSIGTGTDVIGPVTASFSVSETPGLATDALGNPRKRRITYQNNSTNHTNSHFFFNFQKLNGVSSFGDDEQEAATNALVAAGKSHLTRSFISYNGTNASDEFFYVQPKPIPQWSIEMTSSNNTASFFALTASFSGAADFGVKSGSFIGKIIESSSTIPRFYNGTNANPFSGEGDDTDGKWHFVAQKAITEGEGEFAVGEENYAGDTGTNVAFTPISLVIWYPPEYTYNNVRSASFYFTPYPSDMQKLNVGAKTRDLVTGSISSSETIGTGELRTLYWLNHTYTSSFTGSFGNFTRDQLRNQTGDAANHQLPYMNTSIRRFGKKEEFANASHLFKDTSLSIPADKGYYVHSASFSQASKNQMSASLGSANHTSSFFVYGSFVHPFIPFYDRAIMNYTASQEGMAAVNGDTTLSYNPILSCIFLKRYDDQVFLFQPKDGQAVVSESVG